MAGLSFLSKKSWHTSNLSNQEKVWLAEQKAKAEEAKTKELQDQIKLEREREEFEKMAGKNCGRRAGDRGVDWMYEGSGGGGGEGNGGGADEAAEEAKNEAYLLGKDYVPEGQEKHSGDFAVAAAMGGVLEKASRYGASIGVADASSNNATGGEGTTTLRLDDAKAAAVGVEHSNVNDWNQNFHLRHEDPMFAVHQKRQNQLKEVEKKKRLMEKAGLVVKTVVRRGGDCGLEEHDSDDADENTRSRTKRDREKFSRKKRERKSQNKKHRHRHNKKRDRLYSPSSRLSVSSASSSYSRRHRKRREAKQPRHRHDNSDGYNDESDRDRGLKRMSDRHKENKHSHRSERHADRRHRSRQYRRDDDRGGNRKRRRRTSSERDDSEGRKDRCPRNSERNSERLQSDDGHRRHHTNYDSDGSNRDSRERDFRRDDGHERSHRNGSRERSGSNNRSRSRSPDGSRSDGAASRTVPSELDEFGRERRSRHLHDLGDRNGHKRSRSRSHTRSIGGDRKWHYQRDEKPALQPREDGQPIDIAEESFASSARKPEGYGLIGTSFSKNHPSNAKHYSHHSLHLGPDINLLATKRQEEERLRQSRFNLGRRRTSDGRDGNCGRRSRKERERALEEMERNAREREHAFRNRLDSGRNEEEKNEDEMNSMTGNESGGGKSSFVSNLSAMAYDMKEGTDAACASMAERVARNRHTNQRIMGDDDLDA